MAYVPTSENDYTVLSNNIAVWGSKVVLAPNSNVINGILHNLQTIYAIEKQRRAQVIEIKERLDKIESILRKNDLLPDEDEPEDWDGF